MESCRENSYYEHYAASNLIRATFITTDRSRQVFCVRCRMMLITIVIGHFLLFIVYGSFVLTLWLETLHVLSYETVTFSILHEYSERVDRGCLLVKTAQNLALLALLIPVDIFRKETICNNNGKKKNVR